MKNLTDAAYIMKLTERQRTDAKLREIAKLHDERQQSEFGGNLSRRALSRFVAGEKI